MTESVKQTVNNLKHGELILVTSKKRDSPWKRAPFHGKTLFNFGFKTLLEDGTVARRRYKNVKKVERV